MSIQVALDNINLNGASRWGHTEYSLHYHEKFLRNQTGIDPREEGFLRAGYDLFGLDLIWNTDDGIINWSEAGRATDMGHATYAADGSDQRISKESPFKSVEDVWQFDAVAEYGLPELDDQARAYERNVQKARRAFPNQLTPGGYYKTIVSGAIFAVGNHLPPNISPAMLHQYSGYLLPKLAR